MKISLSYLLLLFILIKCSFVESKGQKIRKSTPDYTIWDQLLKTNVDAKGYVNYKAFKKDEGKLNSFLKDISLGVPDPKWPANEQLAFWINAYNAYTIKLILNYESKNIKSIKDIATLVSIPYVNSPWDIKFIEIGGSKYDLNNIEHSIIRKKFKEPRIHAALVCASISCPILRREAYRGNILEKQLNEQMSNFINDKSKNRITQTSMALSKVFQWYNSDFTDVKPMYQWVNSYSKIKANPNAKITYLDYDWRLNGSF